MASCDDIRTDLVAYADHALAPEARARVEAHVASCGACKGELKLLEATGRLLDRYQVRGGPAPGLAARVRERIKADEREKAGGARVLRAPAPAGAPSGWRRALPWAVAAAVLLGAGVAWRLGGGESPSSGEPTIAEGPSGPSVRAPGFQPLPPREPLPSPSADPRRQGGELAQGGSSSSSSGAGQGEGPGELAQGGSVPEGPDAPPPELLAKLDMMESLELIESMDLLEAMDDPEDPTQGIDEENG